MPKIPVLIAAHHEAVTIGRTLESLDPSSLEPIVIVNGEEIDGPTATIAKQYTDEFGVKLLQREEQGKLPALHEGLRYLGQRVLDPVLFIDADTSLVFPKLWGKAMVEKLVRTDQPAAVSGMIAYTDASKFDNTVRVGIRVLRNVENRIGRNDKTLFGHNMGLKMSTKKVLDEVMDMGNTWPGEDRALADIVSGGVGNYHQSLDPRTYVQTSARYHVPFLPRLMHRITGKDKPTLNHYVQRAAPGTEFAYEAGEFIPYTAPHELENQDSVDTIAHS